MVSAVDPDLDIDWSTATLIMEPRPGTEVVLLYAITPGAFRALVKIEQRTKGGTILFPARFPALPSAISAPNFSRLT